MMAKLAGYQSYALITDIFQFHPHPHKTRCSVRLYLQFFAGGRMSYLRYLCLFAYSVQYILCGVFVLLMYTMLPVSMDCTCFTAPSVFSND
jgi:hypothetical protein